MLSSRRSLRSLPPLLTLGPSNFSYFLLGSCTPICFDRRLPAFRVLNLESLSPRTAYSFTSNDGRFLGSSCVLFVSGSQQWHLVPDPLQESYCRPTPLHRRRLDRTDFLFLCIRFMNEALNPPVLHAFEQSPCMILCRTVDHGGSPSVQWGKRLFSTPWDIANLLPCNYGPLNY